MNVQKVLHKGLHLVGMQLSVFKNNKFKNKFLYLVDIWLNTPK